jgi:hypothetical protein
VCACACARARVRARVCVCGGGGGGPGGAGRGGGVVRLRVSCRQELCSQHKHTAAAQGGRAMHSCATWQSQWLSVQPEVALGTCVHTWPLVHPVHEHTPPTTVARGAQHPRVASAPPACRHARVCWRTDTHTHTHTVARACLAPRVTQPPCLTRAAHPRASRASRNGRAWTSPRTSCAPWCASGRR